MFEICKSYASFLEISRRKLVDNHRIPNSCGMHYRGVLTNITKVNLALIDTQITLKLIILFFMMWKVKL